MILNSIRFPFFAIWIYEMNLLLLEAYNSQSNSTVLTSIPHPNDFNLLDKSQTYLNQVWIESINR